MRNLAQHEITLREIEDCLRKLATEISGEGRGGDMRPLLLEAAATIVHRTEFVTFNLGRVVSR